MGVKNSDRIPLAVWRQSAETIGEMRAKGWVVRSRCPEDRCRLEMAVNLPSLIREVGPGLSLWTWRSKCRRIGCPCRVRFVAQLPRGKGEWHMLFDVGPPERRHAIHGRG